MTSEKFDTGGWIDRLAAALPALVKAHVAHHFHVSERLVQTVLVNEGTIDRQQFEEMVEAA